MARALEFGMFDWSDAGPGTTAELYKARLEFIELAERAGFRAHHLAEHHGTPLAMAPSPALFISRADSTHLTHPLRTDGLSPAALSSAAPG